MENKIIKILVVVFLLFEVVFAKEVDLKSEKYILYNMNDGEILSEKNSHDRTNIASLTKIMSVIVAIENIDNYDSKIKITDEMINDIDYDVAKVGFKVGQEVTYNDLLYGAIISSGADAVNALSISVSGKKDKFIKLMNDKVNELGLKDTNFTNVIGLYDKNNYSSAYDMSQILIYALNNAKFSEVFKSKDYTYSSGKKAKSTIVSYNSKSKNDISFITGSKTGYIKASGYCLASTAELNNVNYLLVTLNAYSSDSSVHIEDHVTMYTYFNDNYGYKNIVDTNDLITTLKTKYSKEKEIDIYSNVRIEKYLENKFDKSKVKYIYDGMDVISPFTKSGKKLGHVKIIYEDNLLDEFDLIYDGSIRFNLLNFMFETKTYLIVVLLISVLYIFSLLNSRKFS